MEATNTLGYLLQHVAATLSRQTDQVLQERLGVGFSQFKIMMVLQDNPGIQQNRIADMLGQTEASISRQIKLLTEQGLLTSRISQENRRKHLTALTPRGLRFTEEALRVINHHHAPVFDRLSEKQQIRLMEALKVVHAETCSQLGADHQI